MNKEQSKFSDSCLAWPLLVFTWGYFFALLAWLAVTFLVDDHHRWSFVIHSFSIYIFLPLPFILLFALLLRKKGAWFVFGVATLMAAVFYGEMFIPSFLRPAPPGGQTFSVMTYNAYAGNIKPEQVVATLQTADVDIVALQELNRPVAAAIEAALSGEYPYRYLDLKGGIHGWGVLSRYPLDITTQRPDASWIGEPCLLFADISGRRVGILNLHTYSTDLESVLTSNNHPLQVREEEARAIYDFARNQKEPLVVLVDLNASDQNITYRIVTEALTDAWRVAGFGLGNTFPAWKSYNENIDGFKDVPTVGVWLLRIDYVFYSAPLIATSARVLPWDGSSDHLPLVAELVLPQ